MSAPRVVVPLVATLAYREPFDWHALLAFLAARAIPGIETVDLTGTGTYARTVSIAGCHGWIRLSREVDARALRAEASPALVPVAPALLLRARWLCDLDADPESIAAALGADRTMAPLLLRRPGLRVPGAMDGFELAVRAVLGQQVSVRGATTLAGRLAGLVGVPYDDGDAPEGLARLPISALRLADAGASALREVGLTQARAECLISLARAAASGEVGELSPDDDVDQVIERLLALPGIGPWTAQYVAMRALRWADAFPDGDLVLRKAAGGLTRAELRRAADLWRPLRAYATMHLWASLG